MPEDEDQSQLKEAEDWLDDALDPNSGQAEDDEDKNEDADDEDD